jgi:hypothetical protein
LPLLSQPHSTALPSPKRYDNRYEAEYPGRTSENPQNANFALTEFCEVQVLFVLWGTYLFVGQEYAAFVAWHCSLHATHIGVGCSLYAPPLYSEEVEQDEDCRE